MALKRGFTTLTKSHAEIPRSSYIMVTSIRIVVLVSLLFTEPMLSAAEKHSISGKIPPCVTQPRFHLTFKRRKETNNGTPCIDATSI